MLLRESVVGECVLDRRFHQLGGPGQFSVLQAFAPTIEPRNVGGFMGTARSAPNSEMESI
jgi:hypothetical protein